MVLQKKTAEKKGPSGPQRKKAKILAAAKKVFYSKGYLKATMDDIAHEAGMSKPLIYRQFQSKDDLYFSLMIPVFDESRRQLDRIEKKLTAQGYTSGPNLVRDMFRCLSRCLTVDPDALKIIQLFQHTGMVWELDEKTRAALFERGRYNFEVSRRIVAEASGQGLLKPLDPHRLVDTIWGGFLGIVRLEDTKSADGGGLKHLNHTLKFFENLVTEAIVPRK